jgi:hypothetical protein
MPLSENQKQIIVDNYFEASPPEIAIMANASFNQVRNFIRATNIQDIKQRKTNIIKIGDDETNYIEPKFSKQEIQMLNESINNNVDLVESNFETINGKQCLILQSRLNYV